METLGQTVQAVRPDGTITTVVRVLDDLGMIDVPVFDGYDPEKFYVSGENEYGVNVWMSDNVAQLVKRSAEEGNALMPEHVHCWQSVIKAPDDQVMEAYGRRIFKSVSRALQTLASLVHRQAQCQDGVLRTDGYAAAVHVQVGNRVWWLYAYWYSALRCWSFYAGPLPHSFGWSAGDRFLSYDSGA